ncbi:MAG: carboxypeptidase regulatory-like domain-containing protein [Chloracidobacterium sp.]|nr:carboxypeptidase regulatory-like domain-containing protein [Chloracidobacterium sp.]MBK7804173.1 carboxypeptidase regulatory-like domain-containing protein [Chloracidobacterium sp.]MBK9766947.1 carboxypeptidase regulatory-like domain-containing protein [Chloracidobacterium sp.]MBL0239565.1 carboxypeptidase regulatory-like domain-containing protein [Chloracidobacterium sp.]
MKILIGLIFVGITVTILCNNASAQEMCVIPEQKVSSIKGIVAFVGAENRIKGAKINLKAKNESDKSITEVETDQDGLFEIKGARKGKYNLVVSYPNAVTLYVPISLSKSGNDKYLHITLGAIIGETCGGGDVELVDESK